MHYLVATDSVHTTAAACDYLEDRLDGDDTVSVVSVLDGNGRDAEDALNVANARLLGTAAVDVDRIDADEGTDPAEAILAAATDRDADVVIVGPHAGSPGGGPAMGSTARGVVEGAAVPVVVVPLSE